MVSLSPKSAWKKRGKDAASTVSWMALALFVCAVSTGARGEGERTRAFPQETRTFFDRSDGLPDNEVRAVCLDGKGRAVVLTPKGLARFEKGAWVSISATPFEARHLAITKNSLYVASDHSVAVYKDKLWGSFPSLDERTITCLYATPDSAGLLMGTDAGLMTCADGGVVPVPGPDRCILAIAHAPDGELALGTDDGLYARARGESDWTPVLPDDGRRRWAPIQVAAVTYDRDGNLWFGSSEGAGVREGDAWRLFTGQEGLPYNEFVSATPGEGNVVWLATGRGAIRCDQGHFAYRCSRRWLLDDQVNGIAVESDGAAWIATPAGLSRIERRPMTLDEKAAYFTQQTEARHNRDGFIADCRLAEQFNIESREPKISDNDGLYTACYGAAQAFRYAATLEPEAKALAQRSFEACAWLVAITGTGMPARVIIPSDWPEPVNEQYGEAYNEAQRRNDPFWKRITPRFVTTADGEYLWKCDTSSDELAGHYFFYGVYYDLAAESEDEKELVRTTVRAVTDHLVDNGFLLCDHDGAPTRWGDFSPEFLNSPRGWEQRGLNSMMMLSFLKVAEHVTGDGRYAEAARMLRDEHQYHINAMQSKMYFPPDCVVPWDNNLCLLSWYGLIKYEDNPELLLLWRLGLEHAWQHISRQKNALWNLLYQACAARFDERVREGFFAAAYPGMKDYAAQSLAAFAKTDARLEDTLETLRGLPLDLIGYHVDNTHRLDIVLDPTPGQRPGIGWHFDGRALPIEERGHVRQDRDGFALDANEDDGWAEHEGTLFLLPYWLGVQHGFIP
jgi:chloramphenicol 3-O-phosphotransferase